MFNNLSALTHTLIVGSLSYLIVVALLRFSGKRTLSKWNSFDFISTVAYGSMLATLVLSQQTALLQGVLGIVVLLLLQMGLTWLAVRSPLIRNLIKSQPRLLLFQGQFLDDAMKQERVTKGEIRAAIRNQGISSTDSIAAVVLETDGSFSVIQSIQDQADSALIDVQGYSNQVASGYVNAADNFSVKSST